MLRHDLHLFFFKTISMPAERIKKFSSLGREKEDDFCLMKLALCMDS